MQPGSVVPSESRVAGNPPVGKSVRLFRIGGMTIAVGSDLPIEEGTFQPRFEDFKTERPGPDVVTLSHHFAIPSVDLRALGRLIYERTPWAVFENDGGFTYLGISEATGVAGPFHCVARFDREHRHGEIWSPSPDNWRRGNLEALTTFPTDQILVGRLLADRDGCLLHSAGVVMAEGGLLFLGHSGAGKSTTIKLLGDRATVLCDDRIIVRRGADSFDIHGTWSHGEIPLVASRSAPLRAILLLRQSPENRLTRIVSKREILERLLACVIRPLTTVDWWEKTLTVLESVAREVPFYAMDFDKSGEIIPMLEALAAGNGPRDMGSDPSQR